MKIKLTAPPVEGEANRRLVEFLSRLFKIKKTAIEIKRGASSRKKTVRIEGVSVEEALRVVGKAAGG